jgi:hypothetical protein
VEVFLTSAIDGRELLASHPRGSIPLGKSPRTRWIGGWVGLRAGLGAVPEEVSLACARNLSR